MSFLDVVSDMMIPAILQTVTVAIDSNTAERTETLGDGATIYGVKYNRSEATRYFSQTWAADITDVFVTYSDYGIMKDTELKISGVIWKCDQPVNVAELGEVFTIGIKRLA